MGTSVESSWKEQLESHLLKSAPSDVTPTICRVPAALFRISPDHFQPTVFHLGLHNRKPYSEESEELKVTLARGLLPQHGPPGQSVADWNKVASTVVSKPEDARMQYERMSGGTEEGFLDVTKLDDATVASMLALDAICVVAFLQVSRGFCSIKMWDAVLREPRWWGLLSQMETELAMMQNQVPMSCLKGAVTAVMDWVQPKGATEGEVVEELEALLRHAVLLLYPLVHAEKLQEFMENTFCNSNALVHCKHIVDCLYRVVSENLSYPLEEECRANVAEDESDTTPALHDAGDASSGTDNKQQQQGREPTGRNAADERAVIDSQTPVMSADKLKTLGIKIRSRPCRLSEVSFKLGRIWNSELLLPQLKVYVTTELELHNLAVYEFLQYPWHGQVRKYLRFMNDLVGDATDAKILVSSGAILNYLGGLDEIVSIWGGLNRYIPLPSPADDVSVAVAEQGIRKHCRQFRRTCLADIRSKLFGRPTLFFSAVFALILLLLTAVQTYLTIVNSSKWHL